VLLKYRSIPSFNSAIAACETILMFEAFASSEHDAYREQLL
jgi:hypothetical protein